MKQKAPTREELLKAGKIARDMMAKRGIIMPDNKSAIEHILKNPNSPILPGVIPYLPYSWTVHRTRQVLYDLIRIWEFDNKGDDKKLANITEFFKFIVKELNLQEKKINDEIKKKGKLVKKVVKENEEVALRDIMEPFHKKYALRGIRKLLVDSFAVSIVAKNNDDVVSYVEWFFEWTDRLLKQWGEKQRKIK